MVEFTPDFGRGFFIYINLVSIAENAINYQKFCIFVKSITMLAFPTAEM